MKEKRTGAQQNGCVSAPPGKGEIGRKGDSQTLGHGRADRFGTGCSPRNLNLI